MKRIGFIVLTFIFIATKAFSWGFHGHKMVNRSAVFALPPEMFVFYKKYIDFITDHSVDPDRRRYSDPEEACRHYIDIDYYEKSLPIDTIPHYWTEAVKIYGKDTLAAHGIVPWHIILMKSRLTEAFRNKDMMAVLRLSADIGHYIADAHVPLHTTHNYNGQFSGQHGIHAFWESRLPELFSDGYDMVIGQCYYIDSLNKHIWQTINDSYACLDSVLGFEKRLTKIFGDDRKYGFEEKSGRNIKVYAEDFSMAYARMLDDQVERRLRLSALMTASIWYTCWFDAGQPVLDGLDAFDPQQQTLKDIDAEIKQLMLGRQEE